MRLPRRLPIYPFGDNEPLYFGWNNDVGIYWDGNRLIFNPATGQQVSFTFGATMTTIRGGTTAGSDLRIYANRTDDYSFIRLDGSGDINIVAAAGEEIYLKYGTTQGFKFVYAANVSTVYGGAVAGDDLELEANSAEAGAAIILEGLGDVALNPAAGSYVKFGAHVGTGDVVSNGHIIIEDAAGNARKLMTTA